MSVGLDGWTQHLVPSKDEYIVPQPVLASALVISTRALPSRYAPRATPDSPRALGHLTHLGLAKNYILTSQIYKKKGMCGKGEEETK